MNSFLRADTHVNTVMAEAESGKLLTNLTKSERLVIPYNAHCLFLIAVCTMAPLSQAVNNTFVGEIDDNVIYRGDVDKDWTVLSCVVPLAHYNTVLTTLFRVPNGGKLI